MSATRKTKSKDAQSDEKPSSSTTSKPTRPDEMSAEVIEFITAVDEYKRVHNRPFPSWSEILDVLKGLGYEKPEGEEPDA